MLNTAIAAARAAGEIIKDRFAEAHQVTRKGLRDVVTETDYLAQEAIVARIRERFPEHRIVAEEAGYATGQGASSPYCWFIDPLDGTTNYSRGIPFFSVSIAVACNDDLQAGVIYDPLGDRLFQAARGEGAFLNGRPLRVSSRTQLLDALLNLGWARGPAARQTSIRMAQALGPLIGTVRTMGSAALGLAAVAAGWEDLFIQTELSPWDMAAGVLLVREAGGEVTAPDGGVWHVRQSGGCLASNGVLHQAALKHILPALSSG